MKTELLRSYSSNNLASLSRTSSKISLVLDRNSSPNLQQQSTGCHTTNNKESVNLNVTLDKEDQNEDNVCLHKIFSEKGLKKGFPILKWLPQYSLGKLLVDAVAGITIGLTVLPQGLAYASLAGLPPQVRFLNAAYTDEQSSNFEFVN